MKTFWRILSVFLCNETHIKKSVEDGRSDNALNCKNSLVQLILIQYIFIVSKYLLFLDVFVYFSTYAYFIINYWPLSQNINK
jgi:hypothetical protein